jgi:hypothetical protein
MFSMFFALIAAAALYSGTPWLLSFALTALFATIFPVLIVLLILGALHSAALAARVGMVHYISTHRDSVSRSLRYVFPSKLAWLPVGHYIRL